MSSKLVIQQPAPVMDRKESDTWGSGICDCTQDMSICCLAFWCCSCHACKFSRDYGQCLCLPLLDMFGCIPPALLSLRVSMRHRYGITGTVCNDCLYATCCNPCAWCQMAREMKERSIPIVLVSSRNQ